MNTTSIVLSLASLTTLILGLYAWRLTSSKPLIINMLFGSAGLLIAAYGFVAGNSSQMTVVIPFFITMLLTGRAVAISWRAYARGEKELLVPSSLVSGAAMACLAGTIIAYVNY